MRPFRPFAAWSSAAMLFLLPGLLNAQERSAKGDAAKRDSAQSLGKVVVSGVTGRGSARAAAIVDSSALKRVAPGTSALKVIEKLPGNIGDPVQYSSAEPTARQRFLVPQMGGNGINGFLSFSRFDTDKWKGGGTRFSSFLGESSPLFGQNGFLGAAGQTWHEQVNAKVNSFAGSAKFTAFYNYANRKESDYMDLSLGVFNRTEQDPGVGFGPMCDYLTSWQTAKQFAEASVIPTRRCSTRGSAALLPHESWRW